MKYLLDTDTCIYIIRQKPPSVIEKFRHLSPLEVSVSSITVAELEYGIARSRYSNRNRRALERFLLPLVILPFEAHDARVYGAIRQDLQKRGKPIGAMDLLIASQALRHDLILVSNNTREFSRIRNLRRENWAG